jgi:hypothetical protein
MTLDGAAYELPMWEPHIYAAEFSSSDEVLLPTPSASDTHGAEVRSNRKSRGAGGASLRDLPNLLPTPVAEENRGTPEQHLRRKNKLDGYNRTKVTALGIAVKMLPTPTTQDANNNGGPSQWSRNTDPLNVVAVKASTGECTEPPLNDGSPSLEVHPAQLMIGEDST